MPPRFDLSPPPQEPFSLPQDHVSTPARPDARVNMVYISSNRLQLLGVAINQICDTLGVPGASIGIVQHGRVLFSESFGFEDVSKQTKPSSTTLYGVGSLSKAFVAIGVGNLVEEGSFDWDTPINDLLPAVTFGDSCTVDKITISDLLSHRSGLSGSLSTAFQGDGDFLISNQQLVATVNALPKGAPFRNAWIYNNYGYALAGDAIKNLSGQAAPDFLVSRVFRPLGMNATTLNPTFGEDDRVAKAYASLSDASPFLLPARQGFNETFFDAAGGAYSNLEDMLTWSKALLSAMKTKASKVHALSQIERTMSNHVNIFQSSYREYSYGMGWIRTQLPSRLGVMGDNADVFEFGELPVIGRDDSRLLLYHQGSTIGYYSCIVLDPSTDSAIVVLTNSVAISDAADWLAQAALQALLGDQDATDYVAVARQAKQKTLARYEELRNEIEQGRDDSKRPSSFAPFLGRYYNAIGTFFIEIRLVDNSDDQLVLLFQGKQKHSFPLRYWQENTFEWSLSFDEAAKRGRYHIWAADYFKFNFELDVTRHATTLLWKEDPMVPHGTRFYRRAAEGHHGGSQQIFSAAGTLFEADEPAIRRKRGRSE